VLTDNGPHYPSEIKLLAEGMKFHNVKHIIKCHLGSLNYEKMSEANPLKVWHTATEKSIKDTGISYTFLHVSNTFDIFAYWWGPQVKATRSLSLYISGKASWLANTDLTECICEIATHYERYQNQIIALTGPPLDTLSLCQSISKSIDEEISGIGIQEEHRNYKELLMNVFKSIGWSKELCIGILYTCTDDAEKIYEVTDSVEKLLGRKPKTFDQWAYENSHLFL